MVDEKIVRDIFKDSPEDLEEAIRAFRFLQIHGVFQSFIDSDRSTVLNSFGDENEEVLARRIRELRQASRVLTALNSLFNTTAQGRI